MRPIVSLSDFPGVRAHLRENFTEVDFCEKDCGCARPNTRFEVLEDLEYPVNQQMARILPIGRYEIIGTNGGLTSHQVELRNLDTGEECNPNWGYFAKCMIDWRGTREIP